MTETVPINGELNVIKHSDNLTFFTLWLMPGLLKDLYVLLKTFICRLYPKNCLFFNYCGYTT